jgi:hypothetical protein
MTTNTTTTTRSPACGLALQRFIEVERARLLVDRKEKALNQALLHLDLTDDSPDLAWYYAETQKVIEEYDAKRVAAGLA